MYRKVNIKTMTELSQRLGVPLDLIEDLKKRKAEHYFSGKFVVKNRKKRPYVSISKQGKEVLKRLNHFLATEIDHPDYVHGGVPKRNIHTNAENGASGFRVGQIARAGGPGWHNPACTIVISTSKSLVSRPHGR